jgi:endonuclease I
MLLSVGASATYKSGYYDKMDGKKKEELKQAAKECVQSHTMLDYTNLPNNWVYTDVYPDLVNGNKRWWEMYSDENYYIKSGQTGLTSFRSNNMQREHSVPKSWWGSDDSSPAWTDIFNLYPSDGPANQAKSNYPLGPVGNATFNNGVTKVGTPAAGYGGTSGNVFEPADEYKGDFARAYFYVFTVYNDLNWTSNAMGSKNDWPTLKPWAYEMLLQWARQDPVSQKEINRNDAAERQQGNRNPFIDFPELAEYIWGTRTTETFYISDQDGTVTPPITGDAELTAPIDGESIDFGEVAIGGVINSPVIISGSNLSSALSVLITGTDKSMFKAEARSVSASSINAQGGTKLNISYTPTSVGTHTASLTLYDGGLASQVNVTLMGEAYPIPTLSTPVATDATNISDTSYTANWNAVEDVVDYYVVTRTRYEESGSVTTTTESDVNYCDISDRDVNVAESYYVQSSRLGYLSEKSNTILVAAGQNSVQTVDMLPGLLLGEIDGGVVVMNDSGVENLCFYDFSGRRIAAISKASFGETIYLPCGIYIATASHGQKPVKVIVRK